MLKTFVNTGRNGIIRGEAGSASNTPEPLTKFNTGGIEMAKQSLPFSNQSKQDSLVSKVCTIADCKMRHIGRCWCSKHYMRNWRNGDPNIVAQRNVGVGDTPEERFESRLDKSGSDDACWPWSGHVNRKGYGVLWFHGKQSLAHRVAYFLANDVWPTLPVLHSCDNPPCCNPAHLRQGTPADNAADMVSRGRQVRGECAGAAKLTSEQVIEMRALYGTGAASQRKLAAIFCVSQVTVGTIIRRKTWRHI